MGVYIENMEMPNYEQAYLGLIIRCDGKVYSFVPPYGHKFGESITTAVPVPESHGRMIDADALFKEFERNGWYNNADRDIAENILLDAPTIIPATFEELPESKR